MCQAREGQVFVGRKPHYTETMLDANLVDVQLLNTSDWSSSDAESLHKDPIGNFISTSPVFTNVCYPLKYFPCEGLSPYS